MKTTITKPVALLILTIVVSKKKNIILFLLLLMCGVSKAQLLKNEEIEKAFDNAATQLCYQMCKVDSIRYEKQNLYLMPRSVEKNGTLRMVGIGDWCCGFYAGELWQMYQHKKDSFWCAQAVNNTWLLERVKVNTNTHDIGFMIYNSFGKAAEILDKQAYKDVVVMAAQSLASRYDSRVGCIRSWSWGTPKRWKFAVIIDNMVNLELLFAASKITGDQRFYDIAVSHADKTLKNHFRPDGSSYHVVDYNPENGSVIKKITHQGLFDESVWSRGQAWGLYGFTMCYRYTKNPTYLAQAQKIADFWFSQPDMPDDLVPYWDMRDSVIKKVNNNCPRDVSAAAIIASALYELSTFVNNNDSKRYRSYADKIIHSLITFYSAKPLTFQGFLLLHSVGNYPAQDEIDVPINYADYYFLEALNRAQNLKRKR